MKAAATIALPGAVLTCPECHARIGVLVKPLYQHFPFGLDAIRFEKGQEPLDSQANCRVLNCRASYAELDITKTTRTMLVHTEYGWLPRPPPNVKEPKRPPIRALR